MPTFVITIDQKLVDKTSKFDFLKKMIMKPKTKEETKKVLSSGPVKINCSCLTTENEGRLLIKVKEYSFETALFK